jgi:hypothetical protein
MFLDTYIWKSHFFHNDKELFQKKNYLYTKADLDEAAEQVKEGILKMKTAAKNFKIPLSTLIDHLKGKHTGIFIIFHLKQVFKLYERYIDNLDCANFYFKKQK